MKTSPNEATKSIQAAKEMSVQAREALEQDPSEREVEDNRVWETINSALYDIDYALAKATWTTKDYLYQAVDAADEGYDDMVEELVDSRKGLKGLHESLSESRPVHAISEWLLSLERRLERMLETLVGNGSEKE